jgi:hypothetical protein
LDKAGIAARLRGLLMGQDDGDLGHIATRLGVDELSLRLSVDDLAPYPTVDVLAAVVLAYGVDPTWLLTGNYSPTTHRTVADAPMDLAADSIRVMIDQSISADSSLRPPRVSREM